MSVSISRLVVDFETSVTVIQGVITFYALTLATTQRFYLCPPGVMEQEARCLKAFARAARDSLEAEYTLECCDDSDILLVAMTRVGDR